MLKLIVDNVDVEHPDITVPFVSESMLRRTPVPVLFVLARVLGVEQPEAWTHDDLVFLVERAIATTTTCSSLLQ